MIAWSPATARHVCHAAVRAACTRMNGPSSLVQRIMVQVCIGSRLARNSGLWVLYRGAYVRMRPAAGFQETQASSRLRPIRCVLHTRTRTHGSTRKRKVSRTYARVHARTNAKTQPRPRACRPQAQPTDPRILLGLQRTVCWLYVEISGHT
jgi:hypothetical protein